WSRRPSGSTTRPAWARSPSAWSRATTSSSCSCVSPTRDSTLGRLVRRVVVDPMLLEPGLRDTLLRHGQPRLDDEIVKLVAVDTRQIGDAHEHGGIPVVVRRREVQAAIVCEQELFDVEVRDAEHEDVVHSLAGPRIDRIRPAAPLAAEELAVRAIRRPPVLGHVL